MANCKLCGKSFHACSSCGLHGFEWDHCASCVGLAEEELQKVAKFFVDSLTLNQCELYLTAYNSDYSYMEDFIEERIKILKKSTT